MRVRAKISYIDETGTRRRGDEFEVTKAEGEKLAKARKVEEVKPEKPAS